MLDLCIPYKTVDQIQASFAKKLCDSFRADNLVIPKILQPGKYIISTAIDNVDHNDLSNATGSHFHDTRIMMFQNDDNHTKSNDIHILDTDNKAKVTMDELSLQSY